MAAFQDVADEFRAAGTALAAVSADAVAAHAGVANGFAFPLLRDPECQVIRAWGLFHAQRGGIAYPAVFWLGADRRVRFAARETMAGRMRPADLLAMARGGARPAPQRLWPRLADWGRALRAGGPRR